MGNHFRFLKREMIQSHMKKAKFKEYWLVLSRNLEHTITATYNSKHRICHRGHYILYPCLQTFAVLPEERKNVVTIPTEDRKYSGFLNDSIRKGELYIVS